MKIENDGYNIFVKFIGRAKDGLNVWNELKNDANSIEIFLGFSVQDGFGTTEGMCIPIKDIFEVYEGLLSILSRDKNSFVCSKQLPFEDCEKDFFAVLLDRTDKGISFTFKIYDNFCDYVELTEIMNETKLSTIVSELKDIIDKFPII